MRNNNYDKPYIAHQTRKIKPTRRSVSGSISFRKQYSIPFESTLERDFLIRESFSPQVLTIVPQPVQLEYKTAGGRLYRYTPDFLVTYRAGDFAKGHELKPMLVEVKYKEELTESWEKLKPKFKAAVKFARDQGWIFRVFDEIRIRDQVLENVLYLKRYLHMEFPEEDSRAMLTHLSMLGQCPFTQLVASQNSGYWDMATGIAHLWHLIATGEVECDMTVPLSNQTVIWRKPNEQ